MHCLVAIDGSKHGNDALLWTAQQLWKEGMQLDVVTGVQQCPAQPILALPFVSSSCLSYVFASSYVQITACLMP
jgi:hypothetical protein